MMSRYHFALFPHTLARLRFDPILAERRGRRGPRRCGAPSCPGAVGPPPALRLPLRGRPRRLPASSPRGPGLPPRSFIRIFLPSAPSFPSHLRARARCPLPPPGTPGSAARPSRRPRQRPPPAPSSRSSSRLPLLPLAAGAPSPVHTPFSLGLHHASPRHPALLVPRVEVGVFRGRPPPSTCAVRLR